MGSLKKQCVSLSHFGCKSFSTRWRWLSLTSFCVHCSLSAMWRLGAGLCLPHAGGPPPMAPIPLQSELSPALSPHPQWHVHKPSLGCAPRCIQKPQDRRQGCGEDQGQSRAAWAPAGALSRSGWISHHVEWRLWWVHLPTSSGYYVWSIWSRRWEWEGRMFVTLTSPSPPSSYAHTHAHTHSRKSPKVRSF